VAGKKGGAEERQNHAACDQAFMILLFPGRGITMNKILIIFAHPRFEKSKTNRALLDNVAGLPEVTLNDLYEQYPDFNIDVNRERNYC
jgi:hypothetical protein